MLRYRDWKAVEREAGEASGEGGELGLTNRGYR